MTLGGWSNQDTIGTDESVLCIEVSSIQRYPDRERFSHTYPRIGCYSTSEMSKVASLQYLHRLQMHFHFQ